VANQFILSPPPSPRKNANAIFPYKMRSPSTYNLGTMLLFCLIFAKKIGILTL
jgi:hypothetical protein